MKRATLLIGLFLMLSPMRARADSVRPTWQITAAGIFSGGGPESEAFALDWTVSFVTYGTNGVLPLFSGTTTMVGVLGAVNETMQNEALIPNGGYLPFSAPAAQAEIEIVVPNYYPYGFTPLSLGYVTANPPVIEAPYVYSCFVVTVCEAYGTQVGFGLFSGFGPVVQTAKEVPEPGSLVLLIVGGIVLGLFRVTLARANHH